MLGSLAVFVEEGHHVDAGPHHEDHKEEISNHHDIQKCHCIGGGLGAVYHRVKCPSYCIISGGM